MKKITMLILMIFVLLFIACDKDYLDVVDPNRITPDTYWTNEAECMKTLTAAYSSLQIPWWGRWGLTEIGWTAWNYKADELTIRDDRQAWIDIHTFTNIPGNLTTDQTWFYCYLGIFYANQCLKYFPDAGLDETTLNQMLGEARFLRALNYFMLVNYFRNVPLITAVPESDADYYPAQADPADVWAQIEDDCQFAIQNCAAAPPMPGRATSGAASALLGKAHMQQLDWSSASAAFETVINSGKYTLINDFPSLFTGLNENSSESIFEIQFSLDRPKDVDECQPLPMNLYNEGWNEAWPSLWLVEKYLLDKTPTGDYSQRAWGSITFGVNHPNDAPAPFAEADTQEKALWKKYAYVDQSWPSDFYTVPTNLNIIRYADVLLMYAEAQNEMGNTSAAIDAINDVRTRAGVVLLGAGMSQADVRAHLRENERPVELAMENVRWFDLLRWDDMEPGYIKNTFTAHSRRAAANYTDKHKYYPIPQQEVDTNPNIVQNPGF